MRERRRTITIELGRAMELSLRKWVESKRASVCREEEEREVFFENDCFNTE